MKEERDEPSLGNSSGSAYGCIGVTTVSLDSGPGLSLREMIDAPKTINVNLQYMVMRENVSINTL